MIYVVLHDKAAKNMCPFKQEIRFIILISSIPGALFYSLSDKLTLINSKVLILSRIFTAFMTFEANILFDKR